ncbi:MAG TPA: hypothetical protein VFQ92_18865 [Blastocatellia bacterium]|nr:hypothetical protein [Blastocatellia bacterium]
MKNRILRTIAMLSLAAAISVATVSAQTRTHLEADIPFDFVVGEKTLPAGHYTIKNASRNLQEAILIRSKDGSESALIITGSVSGRTIQKSGKLVFHQYGDKHFLAQVWPSGTETGREVRESKTEQERVREMVRAIRTVEARGKN